MITLLLLTSAISSITTGRTSPITAAYFPSFLPEHRAVEDPSQCLCPNTRSVLGIVWSCLSTIFLCTWVAIHPNIPPTGELGIITFLRRLKLLFVAILAPELIVGFAMFQWVAAHKESKKYQSRGWTMAHGHFLIMGGFVLMKGKEDMGTLSCELFEQLDKEGDIEFPSIAREQIQDRSKADFLSKGIVILQTFWFIISCIARHTQGLEVTQLEVVTLAYCSLSAAVYFLWWSKPLDVQTPTPVYLKAGSDYVHKFELKRAESIADNRGTNRDIDEALGGNNQRNSRFFRYWYPFDKALMQSYYADLIGIGLTPEGVPKRWVERDRTEGVLRTVFRCIVILFEVILNVVLCLIFSPLWVMTEIIIYNRALPPGQNGVHTFYSPPLAWSDSYDIIIFIIIYALTPTSFGALHCLAWKAHFPTTAEKVLWRCSSLLTTLLPIFGFVTLFSVPQIAGWTTGLEHMGNLSRWHRYSTKIARFIGKTVGATLIASVVSSFTLYFFARVLLLILSAISLRNLGSAALLDVSWSHFVPHF